MEELLLAALLADPGVWALIGDRAAWGVIPQADALPAMMLTRVTGGYEYDFDGLVGTITPLVQVDCYGSSYGAAKSLARAVRDALPGLAVDPFQSVSIEDETDDPPQLSDGPAGDGSSLIFWTLLQLRICFNLNI